MICAAPWNNRLVRCASKKQKQVQIFKRYLWNIGTEHTAGKIGVPRDRTSSLGGRYE